MVLALRLVGRLDVDRLVGAVQGVVARQDALRCRFMAVDGEPVMVVDPPGPVVVERVGVAQAGAVEGGGLGAGPVVAEAAGAVAGRVVVDRVVAEAAGAVDLAVGPVARFWLVEVGAGEHVLVVGVHHIVFDGWSGAVLVRDLGALYRGEELPPLVAGFADFAVWEREAGVSAGGLAFWREA
ncbi:condensation domain-containing protein, partial [Planobispora rosea]|uniref:condensation domain-containing protein n=1 Tax=Planobispora rosea TaxID=35762 RepID=UPI001E438031